MTVIVAAILLGTAAITIYLQRTASTLELPSVAVLPFKPMLTSADPALEQAMTSALIDRLSRVEGLAVRPLTRVQPYASGEQSVLAIGCALKVDAVLDGYVRRKDDRILISVRLIDVAVGTQLWSADFEATSTNLESVQDAISSQLAARLHPTP
jgi:TolB-like protein